MMRWRALHAADFHAILPLKVDAMKAINHVKILNNKFCPTISLLLINYLTPSSLNTGEMSDALL